MTFKHVKHEFPSLIRETSDDGQRVYLTPNGKSYPSVTTVIKDHNKKSIDSWKARVGESAANAISKNATDRGTAVHEAIEALLHNYPTSDFTDNMMPHAKSVFLTIKKDLIERLDEVHGVEQALFSHKLRLAGTADCIGKYDDQLSIIDFKTALKLKKKEYLKGYYMQLTAYAFMFQELTGIEIKQGVIVIGVDNEPQAQVFKLSRSEFTPHLISLMSWRDKYEAREAA